MASYRVTRLMVLSGALTLGVAIASMAVAQEQTPTTEQSPAKQAPRAATRPAAKPLTKPATAKPAAKATARRGATKIPASVLSAVQSIRREFETGKLRKASDFFTESPNAELSTDVVMALLGRPVGSNDPMDGYIKWQLLSALPKDLSEPYVSELVDVYRRAPELARRPGISAESRKMLDQQLRRAEEPMEIEKALDEEVRRVEAINEPVLNYRDALLGRMPDTYAGIEAGFMDAYRRGEAGMEHNVQEVVAKCNKWAASADVGDLEAMRDLAAKLAVAPMPRYYSSIEKSKQQSGYLWKETAVSLDERKRLSDLVDQLSRKAEGGAGAQDERSAPKTRDKRRYKAQ